MKQENKPFVGLATNDCTYLLDLIEQMDSQTLFTERQRGYTIPKLQKIQKDSRSARLAFQDVEYLLDLIEDDELPEVEQQREMTRSTLLEIQDLMNKHISEENEVQRQRDLRRARRSPTAELQKHFQQTK